MTTKIRGTVFFAIVSLLLWGLAAYLLSRSAGSGDLRTFGLAAAFVALVLSMHTVLFYLFADRKRDRREFFLRHGRRVDAQIVKVGRRGWRTAWRIKASYRDPRSGKLMTARSEILRANPARKFSVGDTIAVYLHPRDIKRYWMETGIDSEYL